MSPGFLCFAQRKMNRSNKPRPISIPGSFSSAPPRSTDPSIDDKFHKISTQIRIGKRSSYIERNKVYSRQKSNRALSETCTHLHGSIFFLFHLLEPCINVIQVAPELVPVWYDAYRLLLLLELVTGLQPATRQIQHGLVDMISPCPLPVSKSFAFFQQVLDARLKVVHLNFCKLIKARKKTWSARRTNNIIESKRIK